MSDVIPATLGDYRIEGLLGQGRIGPIFRGSHMVLGMPVAVRAIDTKYTSAPGFKTRLVHYAHSLTPLVHPNVVRVYHVGEQDGLEYIVNELVSGGTLEPPRADAPWSPSTWMNVGLVRQIAEGLAAVHWKGLVHGDVRRSNLLLGHSDSGQVQAKLADVGLFTLVDEQSAAEAFHHYTRSAGALIGFTVRVIITDGGDDTCAEWIHGEGITFPSECVGLA